MPNERPIRFEAGTQNILGIFSLYYSCKYLLKLGFRKINEIETKNFNKHNVCFDKSKGLCHIQDCYCFVFLCCFKNVLKILYDSKCICQIKKYGVNIGRGSNKYSSKCTEIIEETRQMLKSLVKADDNYQTVFQQPPAKYFGFTQA